MQWQTATWMLIKKSLQACCTTAYVQSKKSRADTQLSSDLNCSVKEHLWAAPNLFMNSQSKEDVTSFFLLHDLHVDTLVPTLFSLLIDKKKCKSPYYNFNLVYFGGKKAQKGKKKLLWQKFLVKALLVCTNGWTNTENKLIFLPEGTTWQMKLEMLSGWPHSAGYFATLGHCCFSNGYCLENYCTEPTSKNQQLVLF